MSTDLQLKGDSLRRQTELSKQYAEKNNLRLVPETELLDIGVSAFRGNNIINGALGVFLNKVEDGQIAQGSYLLVESLDRLSRQDIISSVQLLLRIVEHSIIVVTLQDEKVYSKANLDMSSLIISITLMSRAHEESLTKSRRLGAAWNAKRNQISERKLTSICPAWLRISSDKKTFEFINGHEKIVQRIFEETVLELWSSLKLRFLTLYLV